MEQDPMGLALPEDALADVLRCLPPRGLAVSRCVCKVWRAIVDDRRLLLPGLLPRSVRGIFLRYNDLPYPAFLARPSTEPEIFDKLDFYRDPDPYGWSFASVVDHCNGLLLCQDPRGLHVANPATQHSARLPPPPRFQGFGKVAHLVFDPTESPHYNVLLVPDDPCTEEIDKELRQQETDKPSEEWPASTWVLCVFSSCTGQWEERAFVREGESAGMTSVLEQGSALWWGYSAYWQGALFVQCTGGSTIMRISLSNDKYQVIKLPSDTEFRHEVYLGRSKEGVCCASFHDWCTLRVWILDESCGIDWVLKHHIDIAHSVSRVMGHCEQNEGPWILQDANNGEDYGQPN